MASENTNVVVVAPVVENEEKIESELSIGEGSKERKTMSKKKMIKLRTSDGELFEIDEAIAVQSQTIAPLVEEDCTEPEIPLPNVTGEILSKVIEYCKKHLGVDSASLTDEVKEDLNKWDAEFMQMMFDQDRPMLFDMIFAANYLNVKNLLDQACRFVADMIRGKSPDEIREKLKINNYFTPEEEEKIRQENQWAFDDDLW